jgi:hypothetical protein
MLITNILTALLGLAAACGFNPGLDPQLISELAGGIAAALAIANQVVHQLRERDAAAKQRPGGAA